MSFIVILLLLTLIAVGILVLRAVGQVAVGLADLHAHIEERSASEADLAAGLHRITRTYLYELIEKRVLPLLGYQEPEKTELEKWMLSTWKDETSVRKSGNAKDAQ